MLCSYYNVINYILYPVQCIPVTYLFYTWEFVPQSPSFFLPTLLPPPFWRPSMVYALYRWVLLFFSFSTPYYVTSSFFIHPCILNHYLSDFWRQLSLRSLLNLLTSPSWRCLPPRWWPRGWPGEQVLPGGHWQTAGKYEFLTLISSLFSKKKSLSGLSCYFSLWLQRKNSIQFQIFGGLWHS